MKHRAYALIEVKAVDDEERVIEGIASTPTPDRVGDIVEPLGAKFALPLPLLWQHRHDQPIGWVETAKPNAKGIPFKARLAKVAEPGALKDDIDRAWQAIKAGLVRGVSIGFRILEYAVMENGGWRVIEWEWLELSTVTVPAQADATINRIKAIDTELRAALGRSDTASPGASGRTVVHLTPKKQRDDMKTITERIAAFEAERQAKAARMTAIREECDKEDRTKNAEEKEEFDTLALEIKAIDEELKDLRLEQKINAEKAKPVEEPNTAEKAADTRNPQIVVKSPEKLEPGIEFARFAMCLAAAKGNPETALSLAKTHYPQQQRAIRVMEAAKTAGRDPHKFLASIAEARTKDAVASGTTADSTWAAPLVEYNQFAGDFVNYLRPRTILGRFGTDGIPDLRRIPFNVHIRGQTSGGTGYWVGEGAPKPVTKFDFNDTYHDFFKVAAIAVLTEELIRFSNPSAERLVRDSLAEVLIAKLDADFVDPSVAASANVSPASITNGVVAITSTGTDADTVRSDIASLWAAAITANLPIESAVYITTPTIALNLSLMQNALGQSEFAGMTMRGGNLMGVPVIVSNHVSAGTFILAFASEIWLSDDGMVTIDGSREASIQMLDNPTNNSASGTATAMVSMFQTNSLALRAERFINWSKRRTSAVAYLDDVDWGATESS